VGKLHGRAYDDVVGGARRGSVTNRRPVPRPTVSVSFTGVGVRRGSARGRRPTANSSTSSGQLIGSGCRSNFPDSMRARSSRSLISDSRCLPPCCAPRLTLADSVRSLRSRSQQRLDERVRSHAPNPGRQVRAFSGALSHYRYQRRRVKRFRVLGASRPEEPLPG
jgi:hypothetical protein